MWFSSELWFRSYFFLLDGNQHGAFPHRCGVYFHTRWMAEGSAQLVIDPLGTPQAEALVRTAPDRGEEVARA